MVDVVGAESRAHELLEEIGLLVRTLRGAEARERVAVLVADAFQAPGGFLQSFLPRGLAEHFRPVARVYDEVGRFFDVRLLDQRLAAGAWCT